MVSLDVMFILFLKQLMGLRYFGQVLFMLCCLIAFVAYILLFWHAVDSGFELFSGYLSGAVIG